MNILIFNGSPDLNYAQFDRYMHNYQLKLHHLGHYTKKFQLRDLNIFLEGENHYSGDINYVFNSIKDADLIVFASPLINGRITTLTTQIQNGVTAYYQKMHNNQLEKYTSVVKVPLFGAVVMPEPGFNEHDLLLNRLTQERIATSLRTILSFFITTNYSFTDAICETLEIIKCRDGYVDVIVDSLN